MKMQADKNRSDRSFSVSDSVYLKLQPYVQSSLAPRANQKLAFKFFGPFSVIGKVGPVAYRLKLPSSSTIHDVFHVSQLKKAISADTQVSPLIPDIDAALQFPEQILSKRLVSKGVHPVQQALIKWSGWLASLATWKDLEALRQCFPAAPAWGQAGSLQGGVLPSLILLHHKMLGLADLLSPRSPVCVCRARSGAGPCKRSELACVPCLLVLQIGEQANELVMQDEQHYSMN